MTSNISMAEYADCLALDLAVSTSDDELYLALDPTASTSDDELFLALDSTESTSDDDELFLA